ncbi:hypothetical protein MRB53_042018 [Persea americana]|nr:hypothetical protein MRB53_042018 [Persea americana]
MRNSKRYIAQEIEFHKILMRSPHPHIVRCLLHTPYGFFMDFHPCNLAERMKQPIVIRLQHQWIAQLASALSHLEALRIAHGDLRPPNILLDASDNIKLADFDSSAKYGEQLQAEEEPYVRLDEKCELPLASATSEMYALGSCVYYVRFGREPPIRPMREVVGECRKSGFPIPPEIEPHDTGGDAVYGEIIVKCWNGRFGSLAQVEAALKDVESKEARKWCEDFLQLHPIGLEMDEVPPHPPLHNKEGGPGHTRSP